MKYISRWAALLLAAMLVFSSASAELTLDGLTQDQLNALYASVSDEETTMELTGVLGEESSFTSSDAASWADLGYTLQWYAVDADGMQTEVTGETAATLDVVYTLEEQRFICTAYDAAGAAFASTPTYIVAAQTTDLDEYLNYLYEDQFLNDDGSTNKLAVYKQVTTTWNVALSDGTNLAKSVVAAWWTERTESYFDFELLCSCVVGSGVTSDDCVLSPYDEHYGTCGWYNSQPQLQLKAGTDADGNPSYTLYLEIDGEEVVLAVSAMLDGERHYFRDARDGELGLYVAYLEIDDDGTCWLIPLQSENATAD